MKRFGEIVIYIVGLAAIVYLALYAYVMLTGHDLQPGAPIRIFRKPDAPSYSHMEPAPGRPFRDIQSISVMAGLIRPPTPSSADGQSKTWMPGQGRA